MLDPRLELWRGEQHPPAKAAAFGILWTRLPTAGRAPHGAARGGSSAARGGAQDRALSKWISFMASMTRRAPARSGSRMTDGGPFLGDSPNAAPPFTGCESSHTSNAWRTKRREAARV